MTANTDTPPGEKKSSTAVEHNAELGVRRERTGTVGDVFASVEVPDPITEDGAIDVEAYAYDEGEGRVRLSISGGVSVSLNVAPDEARSLADAIATAAEAADREVEVDD